MDNMTQIAALGWAARERGVGYGVLECRLTPKEREEIFRAYLRHKREEQARLMKRRNAAAARQEPDRCERALDLPAPPKRKGNGGRHYSFNVAAARSLYNEGYNDCQIAAELGMSVGAIRNWRCRQGLAPRAQRGKPKG